MGYVKDLLLKRMVTGRFSFKNRAVRSLSMAVTIVVGGGNQRRPFYGVAEREGFEPSVGDKPYTRLAGEHLQPLGHLSA